MYEARYGPEHWYTSIVRSNLAWVVFQQGRLAEADTLYLATVASQRTRARPPWRPRRRCSTSRRCARRPADAGGATALAQEALGILIAAVGPDDLRTVRARDAAALNLARLGRHEEAEDPAAGRATPRSSAFSSEPGEQTRK